MDGGSDKATKRWWKERNQEGRILGASQGVAGYFICLQQKEVP